MTDALTPKVVDLFNAARPVEQAPKIHHDMERAVEQLQGQFPEDMAAFVIVVVGRDGAWNVRYSCDPSPNQPIGSRMLAGLATEAIRERLVTDRAIDDALGGSA